MTDEGIIVINDLTQGVVRPQELLFADGKLFQREIYGIEETRFVDVTEEVAKVISKYLKTNDRPRD